eukprot:GFYU01001149.1.p1 GENE.GFYU01001149.1~~GFYU01001149.1.p1  ORF type:complete len:162 (+),score=27.53 GFYU01001149.1:36-521(+)
MFSLKRALNASFLRSSVLSLQTRQFNKVILVGNLGKDPEVHTFGEDKKNVHLSLATSRKTPTGEKTEWHTVKVWNPATIDFLMRTARKGSKLLVEGRLESYMHHPEGGDLRKHWNINVSPWDGQVRLLDRPRFDDDDNRASGNVWQDSQSAGHRGSDGDGW